MLDVAQRVVQVDQPRPRECTFRGHMAIAPAQRRDDRVLAGRCARQRDMSTFAVERDRVVRPALEQARHAETGARAEQCDGASRHRRATADLHQVAGLELGQRQRERGEVVDQQEAVEPQRLLDRRHGERPMMVRHLHLVAGDGIGDADRTPARGGMAVRGEVRTYRVEQSGITRSRISGHVREGCARRRPPSEAGIRSADVAQEPRICAFGVQFRL